MGPLPRRSGHGPTPRSVPHMTCWHPSGSWPRFKLAASRPTRDHGELDLSRGTRLADVSYPSLQSGLQFCPASLVFKRAKDRSDRDRSVTFGWIPAFSESLDHPFLNPKTPAKPLICRVLLRSTEGQSAVDHISLGGAAARWAPAAEGRARQGHLEQVTRPSLRFLPCTAIWHGRCTWPLRLKRRARQSKPPRHWRKCRTPTRDAWLPTVRAAGRMDVNQR